MYHLLQHIPVTHSLIGNWVIARACRRCVGMEPDKWKRIKHSLQSSGRMVTGSGIHWVTKSHMLNPFRLGVW